MPGARAARCVMVQGTASSAGKSMLVTALCRILTQDGIRVAPFKAQNMALNSFVTPEGGEIGRAQAVQAEAAGIAPHVDMNPILLKPEADARCQVVVLGRVAAVQRADEYYRDKDELWPVVTTALDRLRADFEVVVIEGAGSPAEVNLKDADIVNMRVAKEAQAPVLLVGDIDRGGVFASLVGTLELLEPGERDQIKGLVINKFRGDLALLQSGLSFLEQRTAKPVLGVIPYLHNLQIAAEDSVSLDERKPSRRGVDRLDVAVVRLPRIANFDDFDPFEREPGVALRYVTGAQNLGEPDLLILPGTKTTLADLDWLHRSGLADKIVTLAQAGTPIIGVCGGFQMLGELVCDPENAEGGGTAQGLGLLPVTTTFVRNKTTAQVVARVAGGAGLVAGISCLHFHGYEIHMGRSERTPHDGQPAQEFCRIVSRSAAPADDTDGLVDASGRVLGTYVHGLFEDDELREGILRNAAQLRPCRSLGADSAVRPYGGGSSAIERPWTREAEYDRLAAHVRAHLNMDAVYRWLGR